MSFLLLPRMRRPRARVVVVWVAAFALPLALSLAIAYALSVRHFEGATAALAEAHARRSAEVLRNGDALLAELERVTGGECTPATIAAMNRVIFHSVYFREAGIERNGDLICTSFEMLPPRFDIPNSKRIPAYRGDRFEVLSPAKTIRGGKSLILNRPLDPLRTGFINVLLDPAVMTEAVANHDGLTATVFLDDAPNRLLVPLANPPAGLPALAAPLVEGVHRGEHGLFAIARADPFPLYTVIAIDEAGIAEHWRSQMRPAAILGFLLSAIAFVMLRRALPVQQADEDLREGIAAGELFVEYQPIHDGADGRVIGAEALVRWRHPQRGTVMPDEFIPMAERSGAILPLTDAVLGQVRRDLDALGALPPGFRITVNLARAHFAGDGLLAVLDANFGPGARLDRLGFELTERELIADIAPRARALCRELAARGAEVALDDFGTGYSGLSHLRDIAPNQLKIDRSFIRALDTEAVTADLVASVVAMARTLGIGVVAEGVETEAQRERLLALGVRIQQGWLYSRAEGFEALSKRLAGGATRPVAV